MRFSVADELQAQGAFDQIAIDLLRPVPVEVGHRFEATDAGGGEQPLSLARGAAGSLDTDDLLDQGERRELLPSGASDQVIFIWSRTTGLRQVLGAELKGQKEILIPDTQDAASALDYVAQQKKGLFVLCDYSPYLAPSGQEDPQLVRRLRELAWEIKGRHLNVIFVERNFPDLPALEKEIKVVEPPFPDEREVTVRIHSN